jgi:type III secretion system FlhB-like substrate exporter
MGFLKDIHTLKKQAKEIDKTWDPGAQMRAGKERMAAATQFMGQQTAATRLVGTGERADAQVMAAHDTDTQLNLQPMIALDLLVTRAGQPPYPAKVTQVVPQAQLGLVAPGATIPVWVDPADPSTVLLGL